MKRHPADSRPRRQRINEHAAQQPEPAFSAPGQDAQRQLPLTLAEAQARAHANDQYIVPLHIVFLHGDGSAALAAPAQIPWLEEIRNDQYLSDLHSEVI